MSCSWSHVDRSQRRKKNPTLAPPRFCPIRRLWLVHSSVNHLTFPTEVCWATQQNSKQWSSKTCAPLLVNSPHSAHIPFAHFLDSCQDLFNVVFSPTSCFGAAWTSRHLDAVMIHPQICKLRAPVVLNAVISRDFFIWVSSPFLAPVQAEHNWCNCSFLSLPVPIYLSCTI